MTLASPKYNSQSCWYNIEILNEPKKTTDHNQPLMPCLNRDFRNPAAADLYIESISKILADDAVDGTNNPINPNNPYP